MTTGPLPEESTQARCGCWADEVVHNRHRPTCLVGQTIAVLKWDKLPDARLGDAIALDMLAKTNPVWADGDVLRDGAVLYLMTPPNQVPSRGLWQRQGTTLVPVLKRAVHDAVKQCLTYACGLCQSCEQERDYLTNRLSALDEALDKIRTARDALTAAADAWAEVAGWDTGDGTDLNEESRADGQAWLDEAGRALRGICRIIERQNDAVHELVKVHDALSE